MDKALFVGPLDRVLLLRTLPVLQGLGPVQLAAIAQHAQERFLPRNTVLHLADGVNDAIHLIVDGEVEVRRQGGPPRTVSSGAAVGFTAMLSRSNPGLEVQVNVDTTTLELDWDAQLDVCEEHFPVLMRYLAYLAGSTVEKLERRPIADMKSVPLIEAQRFGSRLNLVERVLLLSRSSAFSNGCLDALSELAHHVNETKWNAGEQIWARGDRGDYFLLLASGSMQCRSRPTDSFGCQAGNVLGMYEALSQGPRWHDAVCRQDTVALKVDIEPFIDILEDHFDLALDFLALLAVNLMALEATDAELAAVTSSVD
jgi:CRP-like cAMP-binding protein